MRCRRYASIKELTEYGLRKIPRNQSVTVNLGDYLYIYRTLAEYVRFFHNPDHYPDLASVKEFLGTDSSGGGFEVLCTAVYKKARNVQWPQAVEDMFDWDEFTHPLRPKYYEPYEDDLKKSAGYTLPARRGCHLQFSPDTMASRVWRQPAVRRSLGRRRIWFRRSPFFLLCRRRFRVRGWAGAGRIFQGAPRFSAAGRCE